MKKKPIKRIIAAVVSVFVIAVSVVGYNVFAKSIVTTTATFTQVKATSGTINVTVAGSGTVSNYAQFALTSSNLGIIDSVPVKQGDTVKTGDVIAHINDTNAAAVLVQKQATLATAQANLLISQNNLNNVYIKTLKAGRVKSIICSVGDDLSQIKSLGNLCVISTDGKMKVSVNKTSPVAVNAGDPVTINFNGSSYSGSVDSIAGNTFNVTINDDTITVGAQVAVLNADRILLGNGPATIDNLAFPIVGPGSGTITSVMISENQSVNKGDSLFKTDGTSLQNDVNAKQTSVTNAQNDVVNAQATVDKATIKSPVDGTVASLSVKAGDTASNNLAIATVLDPTKMQTVVSVDELDITKVIVGQKAVITLDAVINKTYSGSVTKVDSIGTATNGVTTYNVTIAIDSPDNVKVSMTSNAKIVTQSKDNVIVVPASAIMGKFGAKGYIIPSKGLVNSKGKSITLNNTTLVQIIEKYGKSITLGMSTSTSVEVVSGLNDGDIIVIPTVVSKAAVSGLNSSSSSVINAITGVNGGGNFTGGGNVNRNNAGTNRTTTNNKTGG